MHQKQVSARSVTRTSTSVSATFPYFPQPLVVYSACGDLDVAGAALFENILEDLVKCVGPGGRRQGLDLAQQSLGAGYRARHGREGRERSGHVEGVMNQDMGSLRGKV
jgi:hypothetical protein